jgi:hypothetical protein
MDGAQAAPKTRALTSGPLQRGELAERVGPRLLDDRVPG